LLKEFKEILRRFNLQKQDEAKTPKPQNPKTPGVLSADV